MRRLFLLSIAAMLGIGAYAAPQVKHPQIKSATSFAVFSDAATYAAIGDRIDAYRDAVERDGLATYIIVDNWANPEAVKEQILSLSAGKMPLEGVLFVGDIPIAMLRDAQHLTSAFKMDQSSDWKDSSVPSDRFYDDFDLRFDFIRQDEDIPAYFYYTLRGDSVQSVSSDIYSARVRAVGEDRMAKMARFFDKAVAEHASRNALDDVMMFRAHGYNSDAMDAWAGEQINLREQFPALFGPDGKFRAYVFGQVYPIKNYILEQLRADNVDAAILHHHGAEDTEYYDAPVVSPSITTAREFIKKSLRANMRKAARRGKDVAQVRAETAADYGLPLDWFDSNDSLDVADETIDLMMDVSLADVYAAAPRARFVIQDACYNGSFHMSDCIANAYIFAEGGKTVLVQGNTVNSIQDRLPDRYAGLWAYGVRIGQWARHQQNTIETHLVGDPTLCFVPTQSSRQDLGTMLALRDTPAKAWLKLLKSAEGSSDLQCIALRRLSDCGYAGIDELLVDKFYHSEYNTVRSEALTLIKDRRIPAMREVFVSALSDNAEIVRRMAAIYVGDCGDDELVAPLVAALVDDKLSRRMAYQGRSSLSNFAPDAAVPAIEDAFASRANIMPQTGSDAANLSRVVNRAWEDIHESMEVLRDATAPDRKRMRCVTYYRNYHLHYMVPELIAFAEDASQPESLRVATIEALGWFRLSYRLPEIIAMCDRLLAADASEAVHKEATKTKLRLI